MKVVRWALAAVILGNLALLAAAGPVKATRLRYEVARRQKALRALSLERRTLLFRVAEARRHDRVMSRAGEFGLELSLVEDDPAEPRSGREPGRTGHVVSAPRW